ncbi:VOC family protein [Nitratireductor pacificus]|uniref:Glyoxalase-like domain-containing protein n=1 Tax=Nitratireductor pacificus pht-3B TaxID=391937 RepID=K2MJV3_9HYPH|nr:VOC family protein [Nitratireductor pacificus]EKF21000.1 hypothetical protein NA2_01440 [Nitratireductor pacificus pht-3B]
MSDTGILDIDHLMVSVADSQTAGELFEAMGFTVTPRSILPGLSNRLICFGQLHPGSCNFIELMALDDADKAIPMMPSILLPPGRPVSMVMNTADAEKTHAALQARDYKTSDPVHLSREWVLPSGEVLRPAFVVIIPGLGQSPFYWNLCQYKTMQHYLRPEFTTHPNGAANLTAVIAVASDPEQVAAHYEPLWGARRTGAAPVTIRAGSVDLRIYSPDELAATFPGVSHEGGDRLFGFAVSHADPEELAAELRRNGFDPHRAGGGAYLTPDQAGGILMVVEQV